MSGTIGAIILLGMCLLGLLLLILIRKEAKKIGGKK